MRCDFAEQRTAGLGAAVSLKGQAKPLRSLGRYTYDMEHASKYIHYVSRGIEIIGVGIIVVGLLFALVNFATRLRQDGAYATMRQQVGKAILLGLEVLVAADIIMTVTTEPTLQNVAVLGIVVLIRTFLSFSLEVELDGRWPWQTKQTGKGRGMMDESDGSALAKPSPQIRP